MAVRGIEVLQLKKSFRNKVAVDVESLTLHEGIAYGLIGTNGAGKTTLLNLIAGQMTPDSGRVDSQSYKIEMVYHETGLLQELKVYENVFLDREYYHQIGPFRYIDWEKVRKKTVELLDKYSLKVDPLSQVKKLDLATQKLLEIVIALSKNPDVLIIDEPLALLDVNQIEFIRKLLKAFMTESKILIYSSHRVDEMVKSVDDVITMRNGAVIDVGSATEEHLLSHWEFSEKDLSRYPKRKVKFGKDLLKVNNMRTKHLNNIRFDVKEGEILGIIGLKGSYKSEIGRALFGAIPSEGQLYLDGRLYKNKTTEQSVEAGICYIGNSEEGLFADDTVYENITAANDHRVRKLSRHSKKLITKYYLDLLQIGSGETMTGKVSSLSAGNKQKVLLAKWFFSNSRIFIFNKPTANVDSSSKVDIYNIFSDLASTGAGVIVMSNDLEEVAGLCDRVLIVEGGTIKTEVLHEDLSVYNLIGALQRWK